MSLFQAHVACRNLTLTWPYLSIPMKVSSCMIVSGVLHFPQSSTALPSRIAVQWEQEWMRFIKLLLLLFDVPS